MLIKMETLTKPSLSAIIAARKHYKYMYPWAGFAWIHKARGKVELYCELPFVLPIKVC